MNKIMYWMELAAPKECSGFGSVEWDAEAKQFKVVDAIVLDDGKSSAYTEISEEALGRAMCQLRHKNSVRWWWHSHVNMGAFWSSTDRSTIIELGQKGWQLATVFNLKRDLRTALCTRVEVLGNPHDIFVDEIPTTVMHTIPNELMAQWKSEFADVVKENKKAVTPAPSTYYRGYDYQYDNHSHLSNSLDDNHSHLEWDESGFTRVNGELIYNPSRDWEISSQEMYEEIASMDETKAMSLIAIDEQFAAHYEAVRGVIK